MATTRYVSLSGDDTTGDGSLGNPYRTIGKAMSLSSAGGGAAFGDGDIVQCLDAGPYEEGDLQRVAAGISIRGVGAHEGTLERTVVDATGSTHGFGHYNWHEYRFIEVTGATSNGWNAVGVARVGKWVRCKAAGNGGRGIYSTANTASVLEWFEGEDNGSDGIVFDIVTADVIRLWNNGAKAAQLGVGSVMQNFLAAGNGHVTSGAGAAAVAAPLATLRNGIAIDNHQHYGIDSQDEDYCCSYSSDPATFHAWGNFRYPLGAHSTALDPLLVDLDDDDHHLQSGSPCISSGDPSVAGLATDLDGEAWGTPLSMGVYAYRVFHLVSIVVEGARTLRATFSEPVDPDTVAGAADWVFTARDGVAAIPYVVATALENSDEEVVLQVVPDLSAGGRYNGQAPNAQAASGGATAAPDDADFAVPTNLAADVPASSSGSILAALTSSIGDLFGELAGPPVTLTVEDLQPGESVLLVESTLAAVAPGAFWLDGIRHTFTEKTECVLTGVVSEVPRIETIPTGSEVVFDERAVPVGHEDDAPGAVSALERLRRDLHIHTADGAQLDRLARIHRFPRPSIIEHASWREALLAVVHGPRGLPGSVKGFLRGALSQWDTVVEVTRTATYPQRLTATAGAGSFTQDLVGRNVLVAGEVYRIDGPADLSATGAGAYVELSRLATPLWSAADWTGLEADTVEARVLPFLIEDLTPGPRSTLDVRTHTEAALVRIRMFLSIPTVPPTYLVDNGDARPVGQPYGGHIMADAFEAGDQVNGPFPIYLGGDGGWADLEVLLKKLVAPGIRVEIILEDPA